MGMIQTAHPNKAHTTANKTAATTKRTARLLNNNECMPRIFRCKDEMILYNITPSQALFLRTGLICLSVDDWHARGDSKV